MLVNKNKNFQGPKTHLEISSKICEDLRIRKFTVPVILRFTYLILSKFGFRYFFSDGVAFDYSPFGSFKPSEEFRLKKEKVKRERWDYLRRHHWFYMDKNPEQKKIWQDICAHKRKKGKKYYETYIKPFLRNYSLL